MALAEKEGPSEGQVNAHALDGVLQASLGSAVVGSDARYSVMGFCSAGNCSTKSDMRASWGPVPGALAAAPGSSPTSAAAFPLPFAALGCHHLADPDEGPVAICVMPSVRP